MLKHSTLLILPLLFLFTGCPGGERMGYVTGKVTLNGEPLAGIFVRFSPQNAGTSYSSSGFQADGTYEMRFSITKKGVQTGPAVVTFVFPPEGDPPEHVKKHRKFLENYSEEIIVKPGSQKLNFDLKTE